MLIKELQSLCLDVRVLDAQGNEIELKDDDEDTYQPDKFRDDDDFFFAADEGEFAGAGFSFKEGSDDEEVSLALEEDKDDGDDELFLDDDE